MKIKTKLLACIMGMCFGCAVLVIGVFALRTVNLKMAGEVGFKATGVEATITNANITGMQDATANADFKMAAGEKLTIDTSMTQSAIDSKFAAWQSLDLTFNEEAEDIVLTFDIKNDSTNVDNYVEIDYDYSFTNKDPNVDVFPATTNNYLLEPNATEATRFGLIIRVLNKKLDVTITQLNLSINLKHQKAQQLTFANNKYTYDNLNYSLSEGYASVVGWEKENVDYIIPAVVKYNNVNYIVNDIGAGFQACTFGKMHMPNTISKINGSFEASAWTDVKVSKGITVLGDGSSIYPFAFSGITNGLELPNSIITIKAHTFWGTSLSSLKLPNSLITLGGGQITCSRGIKELVIPASVTSIGWGLLEDTRVVSLKVDEGNPVYDSRKNCNAIIETATNKLIAGCSTTTIPEGVVTIAGGAIYDSNLKTLKIPQSVKVIEEAALGGGSLKSVTIDSQHVASGLTSLTSQGRLINDATSIYIKTGLDVTAATYLTNTANFTPEKVSGVVGDADGDGYILYTKVGA